MLPKAVTDPLEQELALCSLWAQISLLPVLEINFIRTQSRSLTYILPMAVLPV